MKTNQSGKTLLLWLLGFPLWLAFDLLMEVVVFEALGWNGTTKNDWFFMLWWIVLGGWFLLGIRKLIRHFIA